ncbi:NTP transferase domain-containing protein [Streptomyces sp. NBC_01221]|uniref:nucleotidyltransferase family protein n=1 Tax=Streptomyces sp. NBC_01221 TaxID=2903782 RepID=UPI0022598A02|nr:NTP transferase domain-containing protein [Streptomyces sp. NBC_01221]MCX4791984.1 NTP transferase domain-containing protein [Streptomyces sp. NBC_01221]
MTSVIVLCGGLGTRMGKAGIHRQKAMSEVCGTPLLELILTQVCAAVPAPAPVVLLAGHRGTDVTAAVPDWHKRVDGRIEAVAECAPGAVGVLHLAERLPAPVLIVAGNVLLPYTRLLSHMLEQWSTDGRPVTAGSRQWRTEGHHTVNAQDTTVTSWHRLPHREPGRYEVVDSYLITSQVLSLMRAGPEPISHTRALAALVPQGAVAFREFTGDWLHVQTPADLAVAPSRKDILCPPQLWSSSPAPPEPERPTWPASSPPA